MRASRFSRIYSLLPLCIALLSPADAPAARRAPVVAEQIEGRGLPDAAVLAAMRKVPREEFVPEGLRNFAYQDHPLPIGEGQTISQPYVVALMTELAAVRKGSRALEVGTGSGYQAAVLAEMGAEVWSIEIVDSLARSAAERLVLVAEQSVGASSGVSSTASA